MRLQEITSTTEQQQLDEILPVLGAVAGGVARGAAALGGAIIGGALVYGATRPYYYAPAPVYAEPPVYYAPPPVYYAPPVNTAPNSPAPVLYWDANCQCYR